MQALPPITENAPLKAALARPKRNWLAENAAPLGIAGIGLALTVSLSILLGVFVSKLGEAERFFVWLPLLVLAAGGALTLIAAVALRNRQRQAMALTRINQTLAQRNRELNAAMTARQRLDAELDKAERENRAIIDAVSDVIFELAADGKILLLNASWEKITGFSIEQTIGRSFFDLLHPQDQEDQRRVFEQMIKGRRALSHAITRVRTSAGAFRTVEAAFSMLRQNESGMLRVVGTLTDIEERRRAERALGEAEKKYRTIVENAAGGLYQVTPEGQFLSVNPAMARMLGYASTEEMLRLVMNAHADLYDNAAARARTLRELEQQGVLREHETQVRAKDGRNVWVSENARAVRDEDGSVLYFEGSVEDITKRRDVETKLRDAKVQSDLASRAKSEFLANMSHELRTPLNAIIGFSEIIKNEVLGPLQNKQYRDYVTDIHASGKRLLQIINEILDVSRIEAGERQLNEGIVSLSDVVAASVEFHAQKAEEAQLTIDNRVDFQTPRIVGEELAVKQIVVNLLSNAIKFTPAGGHVTLAAELDRDGQLQLSVTDTGNGLTAEEIAKALSPFGQIDSSASRSGSGAGLGLTLVDSLIRLHGGTLELFSQKGVGTTVTVIFPQRRIEKATAEPWVEWAGR